MALIDFILNIAALLLWLNWRAIKLETVTVSRISILSNLKKTGRPPARWMSFVWLMALLLVRPLFYWQVGPALDWIARIPLGPIPFVSYLGAGATKYLGIFHALDSFPPILFFRADIWSVMLLYSILSFAVTLGLFYLALLLLSLLTQKVSESDPLKKLVSLHLGRISSLPAFAQVLLPPIIMVLGWMAIHPFLAWRHFVAESKSMLGTFEQAAILGLNVYFAWKFFVLLLLLLYLLNSYIYMGTMPFWSYVNHIGKMLLRPIAWMPLQLGRIDLSPVVGMVLVCLLSEVGELGLCLIYKKLML